MATPAIHRSLAALALLLAASACASSRQSESSSASSPAATPAPLRACETRELSLSGADVLITTNADASLATVSVTAPDAASRASALADVRARFGTAHRDARVITHQSKWGIPLLTDACNRPVKST